MPMCLSFWIPPQASATSWVLPLLLEGDTVSVGFVTNQFLPCLSVLGFVIRQQKQGETTELGGVRAFKENTDIIKLYQEHYYNCA